MTVNTPIQFGIMCDGLSFEKWQAECIQELLQLDFVQPSLLIIDVNSQNEGPISKVRRIGVRHLLRPLLTKVILPPRCYRKVDLSDELGHLNRITPEVELRGQYSQHFATEDLERIRSYDLDFILRFAFGIIRGDILDAARYGVWSFHHQNEREYRGATPCFWEILHGRTTSGAILQRLTERLDGGIVLRRGRFKTRSYSYYENLNEVHLGSAPWPVAVCHDIRHGHTEYINGPPSPTDAPIYPVPTILQTLHMLGLTLLNLIKKLGQELFRHERWSIGVVNQPIEEVLDSESPHSVFWLPEVGAGRFLADPFAVENKGSPYVLCEDYRHATDQGIISGFELNRMDPEALNVETLIDEFEHASYPFIFKHDGQWYCVPECHREDALYLFAAEGLRTWHKVGKLLNGVAAADPTVFRARGLWWLAFTDTRSARNRDLCLWYASELGGTWQPHVQNPVKMDICGARPAGTPFWKNGTLYRPAQDCSEEYGRQVVIHRIDQLTTTQFEETPVKTISPNPDGPYPAGLHTLATCGPVTLVDGKRKVFEFSQFRHRLIFFARKAVGASR